jgi:hypothetical protein
MTSISVDALYSDPNRICPGQYFANATLFLTVATMLSAFDIRPGKDEQGNIIIPDTKLTGKSLVR